MRLHSYLCFGTVRGTGNLALVIEDGPSAAAERQAFAAAQHASACVFLRPLADDLVEADYYYPHTRSPLCLHASLAAARLLLTRDPGRAWRLRTAWHGQELALAAEGEAVFLQLQPQAVKQALPAPGQLSALLGGAAILGTPAVASVGSPKLLVQVHEVAAVQPDLDAIVAWGKQAGVNGIYVWRQWADGRVEGRNFNHLDPAREDAATGVAAGALAWHLQRDIELFQGAQLGQPCRLLARLRDGMVEVGGLAFSAAAAAQPVDN